MPNRTFAFSHRGGYWKTRYSFFSNCYAQIDRVFASFNTIISGANRQAPIWVHGLGPNNNFYGGQVGSELSVSFNERPSQNKIFKSVSIEGTNNCEPEASITANNSTGVDQDKFSVVNNFDDKGGILYGGIVGQSTNSNSNVKYVGYLENTASGQALNVTQTATSFVLRSRFRWADGGSSQVSETTKYVLGLPNSIEGFFSNDPDSPVLLTDDFASIPNDVSFTQYDPNTLQARFEIEGAANSGIFTFLNNADRIDVYSISSSQENGDMLRGQYADATFTFGTNDWEVYALNLEYEPTEYDHSKAVSISNTRGRRGRGRR